MKLSFILYSLCKDKTKLLEELTMKITVQTKEIQAAIKNMQKVAVKMAGIPILNDTIKLTAFADRVELTATDIETTATVTLKDVEIIETGSIVFTNDTLKLASKLTDFYMTITESTIESGKRNVKYRGLNSEDYPETIDRKFNQDAFTLSKEQMMDVISATYSCSKKGSSTPVLEGLNINGLNVTSTDRHRMAKKTLINNNYEKQLNIPAYALDYIPKLSDKKYLGEYTVKVSECNNYVQVTFDNIVMDIRLIDGTYPDTSRIIPQSFKTEAKVNRKEAIAELKILIEIAKESINNKVLIDVLEGKVSLVAESESAKLTSDLEAKTTGDDILLGANAEYVLDALENSKNDYVELKFTGTLSPFMVDGDALILPYRMDTSGYKRNAA
jgi:DNA polymerase-3 subunit beta